MSKLKGISFGLIYPIAH